MRFCILPFTVSQSDDGTILSSVFGPQEIEKAQVDHNIATQLSANPSQVWRILGN